MRLLNPLLIVALAGCGVRQHTPLERPIALADSDLVVAGVAYRADSSEVRRILGSPTSLDSSSWRYQDLRIWFKDSRVEQIALTGPRVPTRRGLRIGDSVRRLSYLYGPSCTSGAYNYCRTVGDDPDERGIMVQVQNGVVTDVRVGAVFDIE